MTFECLKLRIYSRQEVKARLHITLPELSLVQKFKSILVQNLIPLVQNLIPLVQNLLQLVHKLVILINGVYKD
jgi:hypothetical protein